MTTQQPDQPTPEQWRRAAERFSTSARFVGHWLARYCNRRHLTVGALAQEWGTTPLALYQLAVCGTPRRGHWTEDLNALAAIGGIDPGRAALLFTEGS